MKILVVPDVHGSSEWKRVKSIPKEDYDYVVFLGDYFDAWQNYWPEQGDNARELFNWIREDTEHRKCVIGNHCFSYISGSRDGDQVSGHQYGQALEIRKIIMDNYDIIDLAEEFDGWVFSHAGFTKTWMADVLHYFHQELDKWPDEYYEPHFFEDRKEQQDFFFEMGKQVLRWDESEFSIKFLNDYWHKASHVPGDENFRYAFEELFDWRGCFSGSGDEVMNSCLWVRPSSLLRDAYYPKQVVGHTEMGVADPVFLCSSECKLVIADNAKHDNIFIFDTERESHYLTEPEYNRKIKKINKAIGKILSMKLTDEDAIRNELMNGGVKKTQLDAYVKLINERVL